MKICAIGSLAMSYHIQNIVPNDVDIVGSYEDINSFYKKAGVIEKLYPSLDGKKQIAKIDGRMYEAEIAWEGSIAEKLLNLIEADSETIERDGILIPSMNLLYMLKMSHRFLRNSPHFHKTRKDILAMEQFGCVISDSHLSFYKEREKATYTYGHPKLNVKKQDFFSDDGVKYIYEHDDIHLAVMLQDKPAYEYFKPKHSEVFCDKDMFFACSDEIRLNAVREESMVLAIERSLNMFPGLKSPKQAYLMALEKVCTSITSGFFREYAWRHYDEAAAYDGDFFFKFNVALANGKIRKV